MAAIPGIGQRAGAVDAMPRRPAAPARPRPRLEDRLALPPSPAVVLVGLVAYPFIAGIILSFQHKVVGASADLGRAAQLPRAARRATSTPASSGTRSASPSSTPASPWRSSSCSACAWRCC